VGQAIPAADFVPVDPIISITFSGCGSAQCSVAAEAWDNPDFGKPLSAMLQSLTIN